MDIYVSVYLRCTLNFSRIVTLILTEESCLAFKSTLRASFLCRVRSTLRSKQAARVCAEGVLLNRTDYKSRVDRLCFFFSSREKLVHVQSRALRASSIRNALNECIHIRNRLCRG